MAESMWHYAKDGDQRGPVAWEALLAMAQSGQLAPGDPVWTEGMADWQKAGTIAGLFSPAPATGSDPGMPAPGPLPYAGAGQYASLNYFTPPSPIFVYAGFWLRVLAYIIDAVILKIINFMLSYVVTHAAHQGLFVKHRYFLVNGMITVVSIVITWLYFAMQESSARQATLGKRTLSLKVFDLQGGRVSFARATGRHFGKFLSALTLCIGFMMAGWTEKKQALHDMLAGTLVVKGA